MGETLQGSDFPQPNQLVGDFQSYLHRTPNTPEFGAIGGRGYDRVVHGPVFTAFVLARTCALQREELDPTEAIEQAKVIHDQTNRLRFDNGRIIPSIGEKVLHSYAQRELADPRVEIARRLSKGLDDGNFESSMVARDTQTVLSYLALQGGFGETGLQQPLPDVA